MLHRSLVSAARREGKTEAMVVQSGVLKWQVAAWNPNRCKQRHVEVITVALRAWRSCSPGFIFFFAFPNFAPSLLSAGQRQEKSRERCSHLRSICIGSSLHNVALDHLLSRPRFSSSVELGLRHKVVNASKQNTGNNRLLTTRLDASKLLPFHAPRRVAFLPRSLRLPDQLPNLYSRTSTRRASCRFFSLESPAGKSTRVFGKGSGHTAFHLSMSPSLSPLSRKLYGRRHSSSSSTSHRHAYGELLMICR